jgi:hypothetical protein
VDLLGIGSDLITDTETEAETETKASGMGNQEFDLLNTESQSLSVQPITEAPGVIDLLNPETSEEVTLTSLAEPDAREKFETDKSQSQENNSSPEPEIVIETSKPAEIPPQRDLISEFYSINSFFLDDSLLANTQDRSFYKLEWKLEDSLETSESSVEIFMFLFRRLQGKTLAIQYLQQLFFAKEKIFNMARILNHILENYRMAKEQIDSFKRTKDNITLSRFSLDSFPRLRSGENF